ncbi:probable apyrase 7 [Rhododendron vialii]|uniref:probable apyrase 7 n=1 Tax=Rhododendron vialii TaxID=182163 RepID=UPI00265DD23B|nr:probable apyrase 7 [Rhododendron vialii]XP_058227400.1 probable apyrase 7 [Rhododendron vialii]XP_058227401.1 probable apyrase 7 [Rhododendron vialii]XP_058227402.1 probable apyrase 7 [Rhododendron vialii]XP_058227404.1 probable apyrase 7 [Rhododendron vialii]
MEPRSPSKVRLPMLEICPGAFKIGLSLLLSLLLLSVGVYVVLRPGKDLYTSEMMYFTVVVDCGSTGTRVSVYEWMLKGGLIYRDLPILIHSYPDNATNAPSRKDSCQYHCMQTEPGLDKFVGNSSGVRVLLEPLIIWAEQWVPPERRGGTPIFVLATAGLRSLPWKDARKVLDDVEDVIKEHRFMYKKSWIRILSGKEEAYYGWVALNYKMGIFNKSTRLPTLGLLDLGGSSLQVVAEIDESDEDEFVMKSKIGSFEHEMLAYSLPAFGLNEAFDRTVVMLSHSQALKESVQGTFEVSHPCLSSSFMQSYSCKGCFGLGSNDSEGFHSQVQRNELNTITLVGEPNWEMCQVLARAAAVNSSSSDWSSLTDSSKCEAGWASLSDSKTVNLKAITHRVSRFHALSGFFAVYTKLNLSPRANLTKIWEKGQQLCSSQISISGNQNYAAQYCFRVPYLASLIENALCLSNKEIMFGPGDVSWTLGAALVEGKFLWLNSKDHSNIIHENNRGVIFSSIFLLIVLLSLLFIVYRCQLKFPMPSKRVAAIGLSLPSYVRPKQRP